VYIHYLAKVAFLEFVGLFLSSDLGLGMPFLGIKL